MFRLNIPVALIISLLVSFTGCSRALNPDATIKRAYGWYVRTLKSGQDPLRASRDGLRPYATDRFLTSLDNLHSDIESNALIDPQAFDDRLAVESVDEKGSNAVAHVVLSGRSVGRQMLNVVLVKNGEAWKIDDVKWIDQSSEF